MLLHLDENYSDDRGGGGENYFLSLPEKIIFHLLTHPLPVFDANKFKKLFLAQNFSTREVFYPGKRLAKCALPSRQSVWVRVGVRVCASVCVHVSGSHPTMPEVLQELLAMQKYFDECCYQLFLVQMEWDGGNLRSLNQSKNSVEEKKLPSFWNGLARTFWMKKCLCSGFITGGGLSGEDLNSLSSNPTDNFVKCLSIIVFIPLKLS